jgi:5-methylcytosine-specific restriction endonuclease McrA
MNKKEIRTCFRNSVFVRDKHKCVMCGKKDGKLDAHHIKDRSEIPNGGYTVFNGITLCAGDDKDNCHWKAEQYHITGVAHPGYSPEELYKKIGSSYEKAVKESEKL